MESRKLIEDVTFWLNKYYQYLTYDCIGKMYKDYYNCKFAEIAFLTLVWRNLNWKEYMHMLSNNKLTIDSYVCKLFKDLVDNFLLDAYTYGVLSLEDFDLYKYQLMR